ncbi:uncharacterized protein PV09_04115 [Verruconis gallopava]|uniref:Transcription factor domain-containing protein n=1 Tax=Verruconis gallopava TaxID=253628 RepID=A0A0D2AET6_9PEZI|nr:uncharacterized protein PV09_04115 [Verruconis gallopava]KIW04950.1 hypothetical protein PV09_04115 [Verruconis gallopava]
MHTAGRDAYQVARRLRHKISLIRSPVYIWIGINARFADDVVRFSDFTTQDALCFPFKVTMAFGSQNCSSPPGVASTDAGVAGAGTLLSFIIAAGLAILISGIIILHEARKGTSEAKILRKMLQSFSDQQILYGIGIQSVGLAKMESMVPYHFFIIWMLSLLSTATHLSTLLALVNDFKRDWVLRWIRQFLMFVNLVLSCVFGIFVLMVTLKNMNPTLPVACVWELETKGAPSNAALSIAGTIAVIVGNAVVFILGVWYLHSRKKGRWVKTAQIVGLVLMIAIAVGATVRVISISQAFGDPSPTVLAGTSEADWSFGQLLPLLLLLLPLLSAIEIIRGEMGVPSPVPDDGADNKPLLGGGGRIEEQELFQPNPFWGTRTEIGKGSYGAIHQPQLQLQEVVCSLLQSIGLTQDELCDRYLQTIHEWLPIIDESKVRDFMGSPSNGKIFDSGVLLWSLYLVTRQPCPDHVRSMRDSTYRAARQLFLLQASENASIELLQAGLLIAYYACGHGFPQDAHIVLANCLSIAQFQDIMIPTTRDESIDDVEKYACSWALILLDRTIALSSFEKPLPPICHQRKFWDLDEITSLDIFERQFSSFFVAARVAQRIGNALEMINRHEPLISATSAYREEYEQLSVLTRNLIGIIMADPDTYTYCASTALAVCVFVGLQMLNPKCFEAGPPTKEVLEFQYMLRILRDKFKASTYLMERGNQGVIPPLANCILARGAVMLSQLGWQKYLPEDEFTELRANLERVGKRWAIGASTLQFIDRLTASEEQHP